MPQLQTNREQMEDFISFAVFAVALCHAYSESLKTFFLRAVNDISRSPKEQLLQLLLHYLNNHLEINDIDIPLPDTLKHIHPILGFYNIPVTQLFILCLIFEIKAHCI